MPRNKPRCLSFLMCGCNSETTSIDSSDEYDPDNTSKLAGEIELDVIGTSNNAHSPHRETRDSDNTSAALPEAAVPQPAVPEAAVSEAAVPEAAVPEAAVPEAAVPQPAVPEAAVPEAAVPEAAVPEAAVPQPAVPEAAVPEAAVPEAAVPEAAVPQPAVPEAAVPEAAVPEAAVPEAAVPEAAVPEAAVPEAAVPEAAVPEAAVPQPAVPEAAVPEAAVPEAAVPEAAVPEAAVPEAAVPEAAEAAVPEAAVPQPAVPEAAVSEAAVPEAATPDSNLAGNNSNTEIVVSKTVISGTNTFTVESSTSAIDTTLFTEVFTRDLLNVLNACARMHYQQNQCTSQMSESTFANAYLDGGRDMNMANLYDSVRMIASGFSVYPRRRLQTRDASVMTEPCNITEPLCDDEKPVEPHVIDDINLYVFDDISVEGNPDQPNTSKIDEDSDDDGKNKKN